MTVAAIGMVVALAASLIAPQAAGAKGAVDAPRDLRPVHCEPGADLSAIALILRPFALGCAALSRSVLLAADHAVAARPAKRRGFNCLYTVPEGGSDADGPCFAVGPEAAGKRPLPVQGGEGIATLSMGRLGGGAFAAVQASRDVHGVTLRYRVPGDGAFDTAAAAAATQAIRVGRRLAHKVGAPHPFRIFVGEVPRAAITCMGVRAVGHGMRGRPLGAVSFEPGDREYETERIDLPGTTDCDELLAQTAIGSLRAAVRRALAFLPGLDGKLGNGGDGIPILHLSEPPQLGVRCARSNSIGCDRVSLAVSLEQPAAELTAWVSGRRVPMRPTAAAVRWEGTLVSAGLQGGAFDTCAGSDPGECPDFWYGVPEVSAAIRLEAELQRGRRAARSLVVPLHPGYR